MVEKLLDVLAEICDDDIVKENLDLELFESGLMDSLGFVELLVGIEDNFGVVISPSEVERGQVDTPQKIIDFVKAKGASL